MLDAPPREPEKQSWIYVAIGVLVIYCTIPVARTLRETIDAQVGREVFLYLTALLAVIGGIIAYKNLRQRKLPLGAYLWLFGILALFGFSIYQLRAIPEEAIHLAEYGVLSLLVYRALTQRMHDYGIYVAVTLIVGIIGMLDEYIQWVVPTRLFDLRDIYTNLVAGGLAQIAILSGLRPALITGRPSPKSWSRICYITAAGLVLLALGFQNTPQRVAWYAAQHPSLAFLMDSESMMAEYGYRHENTDTGVFRSRFTLAELQQLNLERGAEVAGILDRYIRGEGYRAFHARHSVIRDPYAHEAGVHLFRREYYIDRAREGGAIQAEHYLITFSENQILKKYFGNAIELSSHRWSPETEAEVSNGADKSRVYESAVSAGIITRLNAGQTLILFAAAIIALLVAGHRLQRTKSD